MVVGGGERTVLPHAVVPRPLVEGIEAVLTEVHHRHLGPVRPGGRGLTVGGHICQQRLLDFLLPEELLGGAVGRAVQRPNHDGVVAVARKAADEEVETEQEARHWRHRSSVLPLPIENRKRQPGDYVKKSGRKRSEGRASGTPKWRLMVQLTRGFLLSFVLSRI